MKALLFYAVYAILWAISLLPLRALYLISDLLFLLNYHIIGYRRKVVLKNLKLSFPEKSPEEIRAISRGFYRYFADLITEMVYLINIRPEEHRRRFQFVNTEILEDYQARGKSVFLMLAHYGNWEWGSRYAEVVPQTAVGVYKTLQNKYIDRFWVRKRGVYGIQAVPMEKTFRRLTEYREKSIPVAIYSVSDQRPQWGNLEHWMTFLNQDMPVITGTDKLARRFDYPVLFLDIRRPRRGYYTCTFKVLCDDPSTAEEHEITKAYFRILEQKIRERPELWLWTHKRWKYVREHARNPVDIDS